MPTRHISVQAMSVADRNTHVTRLAVTAVLEEWLIELKGDEKELLGRQMRPGETAIPCLDPDDDDPRAHGTSLGTVSKVKGQARWRVTDPGKFRAWVEELFPTEVETVVQVRASFENKVTDECRDRGGFAHKVTGGELVVPPGVECTTGDPSVVVRKSDEARGLVMAALASGGAAAFLLDTPAALPTGGAA